MLRRWFCATPAGRSRHAVPALAVAMILAVAAMASAPAAAAKPREAKSVARGRAWLAKAAELAGGRRAWGSIHALELESADQVTTQGKSLKMITSVSWRLPDHLLSVQRLPFGEMKVGFDGSVGWSALGPQVQEMPAIGTDVGVEWQRSMFHLFGHPDEVTLRAADTTRTIDGVAYSFGFAKTATGQEFTLYFGPDGSLARSEYDGHGPNGPAHQTEIYSDWRAVGGIRWPYQRQMLMDGQPYLESSLNSITLDPALDDSVFKKPGS